MSEDKEYLDIIKRLKDVNPDALLADGFEDALIGICDRNSQPSIALYDYRRCIHVLMERDGMDEETALEHFEFNVIGAWMGPNTPAFASALRKFE